MEVRVLRYFLTVAREGSITGAANYLHLTQPTLSRQLQDLEKELGQKLLIRGKHKVILTPEGMMLRKRAEEIVELVEKTEADFRSINDIIGGDIYIGSGETDSMKYIAEIMKDIQQIYPDIEFDLVELMAPPPKGFIDSEGKSVDLILSYQENEVTGVRGWYVGDMPFIPCASPNYLRRHGMPRYPDDCERHIGLTYSSALRSPANFLVKDGQRLPLKWKNTIAFHSVLALKNALFLGAGVAVDMSLYHTYKEIIEGTLEPVLSGWHVPTKECFTYAQEDSLQCRRIITFVEWLVERQRETFTKLRKEITSAGLL